MTERSNAAKADTAKSTSIPAGSIKAAQMKTHLARFCLRPKSHDTCMVKIPLPEIHVKEQRMHRSMLALCRFSSWISRNISQCLKTLWQISEHGCIRILRPPYCSDFFAYLCLYTAAATSSLRAQQLLRFALRWSHTCHVDKYFESNNIRRFSIPSWCP